MRLLIAVPSKARADLLTRTTWQWLQYLPDDTRIFVEPQDYATYADAGFGSVLEPLPADNQGLGFALGSIAAYAQRQSYDAIFKLDDDVKAWMSGRGEKATVDQSAGRIDEALHADILPTLSQFTNLAGVSFDYPLFNPIGANKNKWIYFARFRSVYIVKTQWLFARPEFSALEDVYATLAIWGRGGITACYTPLVCQNDLYKAPGGLQALELKRAERTKTELDLLQKQFPLIDVDDTGKLHVDRWQRALRKAIKRAG